MPRWFAESASSSGSLLVRSDAVPRSDHASRPSSSPGSTSSAIASPVVMSFPKSVEDAEASSVTSGISVTGSPPRSIGSSAPSSTGSSSASSSTLASSEGFETASSVRSSATCSVSLDSSDSSDDSTDFFDPKRSRTTGDLSTGPASSATSPNTLLLGDSIASVGNPSVSTAAKTDARSRSASSTSPKTEDPAGRSPSPNTELPEEPELSSRELLSTPDSSTLRK